MEGSTLVIGIRTVCMVRESTHGQTVEATKVSIIWTKRMALVFTFGLMAENTRETGLWVSSTARASTINQDSYLKVVFGAMENVSHGNNLKKMKAEIIQFDYFL